MGELRQNRPSPRRALAADVPAIHSLLKGYADMGNLLPRGQADITTHLDDFIVVDLGLGPVACGALEIFTEELAEVRSLVVAPAQQQLGLGRILVEHLTTEARRRGMRRLMALTYVPEFFHQLGFVTVPKNSLPEKVWGICVNCYKYHHCDEIAVLRQL